MIVVEKGMGALDLEIKVEMQVEVGETKTGNKQRERYSLSPSLVPVSGPSYL